MHTLLFGLKDPIYVTYILGVVLFRSSISLMIFLNRKSAKFRKLLNVVLLVAETWVLNFWTTSVDLSLSPFSSVSYCVMYFEALLFGLYTFKSIISPWHIDLLSMRQCLSFLYIISRAVSCSQQEEQGKVCLFLVPGIKVSKLTFKHE